MCGLGVVMALTVAGELPVVVVWLVMAVGVGVAVGVTGYHTSRGCDHHRVRDQPHADQWRSIAG